MYKIMKKLSLLTEPKFGPLRFTHALCPDLCLVGKAKTAKVFIWKQFGSSPRVTLPPEPTLLFLV